MRHERIVRRLMQRYWRWQRALTLGARGMIVDGDGRLFLVRHTYTPGWTFPGGGVEFGETIEAALERELAEEANVTLTGRAELFGVYSNQEIYPGDHVAIYLVRHWHQSAPPQANHEIAASGFFAVNALPQGTTPGTRRRIAELIEGVPKSAAW